MLLTATPGELLTIHCSTHVQFNNRHIAPALRSQSPQYRATETLGKGEKIEWHQILPCDINYLLCIFWRRPCSLEELKMYSWLNNWNEGTIDSLNNIVKEDQSRHVDVLHLCISERNMHLFFLILTIMHFSLH